MREHHVGINLHNEPYLPFENRVSLHLAAGHLVLSEPLDPLHGPGRDRLPRGRHRRRAARPDRAAAALARTPTTACASAAA